MVCRRVYVSFFRLLLTCAASRKCARLNYIFLRDFHCRCEQWHAGQNAICKKCTPLLPFIIRIHSHAQHSRYTDAEWMDGLCFCECRYRGKRDGNENNAVHFQRCVELRQRRPALWVITLRGTEMSTEPKRPRWRIHQREKIKQFLVHLH
jgi:hypothetical protein